MADATDILDLADRQYEALALNARATATDVQTLWRQLPTPNTPGFRTAVREITPAISDRITVGQFASIRTAEGFFRAQVAAQNGLANMSVEPSRLLAPTVNLIGDIEQAADHAAYMFYRKGVSPIQAQLAGLGRIVQTTATNTQDAGREAVALLSASTKSVHFQVRKLRIPSCKRCFQLAGRRSRSTEAFRRHPNCDCVNIPIGFDVDLTDALRGNSNASLYIPTSNPFFGIKFPADVLHRLTPPVFDTKLPWIEAFLRQEGALETFSKAMATTMTIHSIATNEHVQNLFARAWLFARDALLGVPGGVTTIDYLATRSAAKLGIDLDTIDWSKFAYPIQAVMGRTPEDIRRRASKLDDDVKEMTEDLKREGYVYANSAPAAATTDSDGTDVVYLQANIDNAVAAKTAVTPLTSDQVIPGSKYAPEITFKAGLPATHVTSFNEIVDEFMNTFTWQTATGKIEVMADADDLLTTLSANGAYTPSLGKILLKADGGPTPELTFFHELAHSVIPLTGEPTKELTNLLSQLRGSQAFHTWKQEGSSLANTEELVANGLMQYMAGFTNSDTILKAMKQANQTHFWAEDDFDGIADAFKAYLTKEHNFDSSLATAVDNDLKFTGPALPGLSGGGVLPGAGAGAITDALQEAPLPAVAKVAPDGEFLIAKADSPRELLDAVMLAPDLEHVKITPEALDFVIAVGDTPRLRYAAITHTANSATLATAKSFDDLDVYLSAPNTNSRNRVSLVARIDDTIQVLQITGPNAGQFATYNNQHHHASIVVPLEGHQLAWARAQLRDAATGPILRGQFDPGTPVSPDDLNSHVSSWTALVQNISKGFKYNTGTAQESIGDVVKTATTVRGVDPREALAHYTSEGYHTLNAWLRNELTSPTLTGLTGGPSSARDHTTLPGLVSFNNGLRDAYRQYARALEHDVELERGLSKLDVTQYQPGQTVVWPAWTSTTHSTATSAEFGAATGYRLTIKVPKGIKLLPGYYDESELILPPNTALKVDAVDGRHIRLTVIKADDPPALEVYPAFFGDTIDSSGNVTKFVEAADGSNLSLTDKVNKLNDNTIPELAEAGLTPLKVLDELPETAAKLIDEAAVYLFDAADTVVKAAGHKDGFIGYHHVTMGLDGVKTTDELAELWYMGATGGNTADDIIVAAHKAPDMPPFPVLAMKYDTLDMIYTPVAFIEKLFLKNDATPAMLKEADVYARAMGHSGIVGLLREQAGENVLADRVEAILDPAGATANQAKELAALTTKTPPVPTPAVVEVEKLVPSKPAPKAVGITSGTTILPTADFAKALEQQIALPSPNSDYFDYMDEAFAKLSEIDAKIAAAYAEYGPMEAIDDVYKDMSFLLKHPDAPPSLGWMHYIGNGFTLMNQALRSPKTADASAVRANELFRAFFDTYSTVTPSSANVARVVTPAKNFNPAVFQVGDEIVEPGWSSTTIDKYTIDDYVGQSDSSWVYQIEIPAGKRVLAGSASEGEIILPPNTAYRVLAIDKKTQTIKMEVA